ncbi:MAG: hypothetical protein ACOYD0_08500 [Candidatus Nanopelagicales bacterium]
MFNRPPEEGITPHLAEHRAHQSEDGRLPGLPLFNLRIAGASGAAVFMTSTPWIGNVEGHCVLAERFRITFSGDDRLVELYNRVVSDADLLGLRDFLYAAMTQDLAHIVVPPFEAVRSGLTARVLESTDDSLGLEFSARCYLDDDDQPDVEGVAFDTPRLALWEAVSLIDERLCLGNSAPEDASELGGL